MITALERILPLAALATLSAAGITALHAITGGRELADDAANLRNLVFHPFSLWGDYRAAGFSDSWGSFPPLLPLIFGLLVRPWHLFLSDFAAIRVGVLTWTAVVYFLLPGLAQRTQGMREERVTAILWIFAVLPSVLLAIIAIPQEEIYVSIFSIALLAAGLQGRWRLVPFLVILTALAGKYFLLVLIVPLALASDHPKRNIVFWGGLSAAVLGAYVLYHWSAFDLRPILGHVVPYDSSLSVWALIWNLGLHLEPAAVKAASVPVVLAAVLAACAAGRRRNIPLQHSFAVTLLITLVFLSITFPGYILWAVPLILLCAATADNRRMALITAWLFAWGIGEAGANFFRGVLLALSTDRGEGKTAVAGAAERLLGPGFPYHAMHVACLLLVLAAGAAMASMIWMEGCRLARLGAAGRSEQESGSRTINLS